MNPVCCNKEMRVAKNGVKVAPEHNPNWVRSGDQYECRECGHQIIFGFGEAFHSPIQAEVLLG